MTAEPEIKATDLWEGEVSRNVLVDPSLILGQTSLRNTWQTVSWLAQTTDLVFYVSPTFHRVITDSRLEPHDLLLSLFLHNAVPADRSEILDFLESGSVHVFEPQDAAGTHFAFLENLRSEPVSIPFFGRVDDLALDIIFEEWVFLQEKSWLASRTKRIFQLMIQAGAASLEIGARSLDSLTRRTLKKQPSDIISRADKLRALAKWIAVGGSSTTAFFSPMIAALGSGLTGAFFLIDP